MSNFNDKALRGVADAVAKIMDEELKGNQHKIDANKNGKVDAHDFKLLRAKKGMKEEVKKNEYHIAGKHKFPTKDEHAVTVKHTESGREHVHSGKGKYLSKLIKSRYDINHHFESVELDEAFPTVDDAKKRMDAGKTSTGTVTKTKTGLVHKRDYKDDDSGAEDMQKKSKGYGARQNFKRSSRVNEQLSFTEMLHLYNEHGVEVINKIAPQTVKFGDTEVELIDADIVNGAVGITVAEEVDNETFTKEVEAQKEKNAGRGKKAEVAKASVQAVEVQKEDAGDPDTKVHLGPGYAVTHSSRVLSGKPAKSKSAVTLHNKSHWQSDSDSRYHHVLNFPKGTKFTQGPSGIHAKHPKIDAPKNKERTKTEPGHGPYGGYSSEHGYHIHSTPENLAAIHKSLREEHEQIDEVSKKTLGSYIKAASHDVATKGALTRHFADKSRREKEEKKGWEADKSMKKADKTFAAGWKRRQNMAKAVDRLTKEEVQLDESLPASASAGDYIHDFVHSDNAKFDGKSTKERQKMALGAFYAKNKGK